jgi:hypothetical protein
MLAFNHCTEPVIYIIFFLRIFTLVRLCYCAEKLHSLFTRELILYQKTATSSNLTHIY